MKSVAALIISCFLSLLFSSEVPVTEHKVVIVGAGITGVLESYYAHRDAVKKGTPLQIVIYEKSSPFVGHGRSGSGNALTNTAFNIFPSLTPDEILSVVPRGPELTEKLGILFSEPGGIRVDDAPGVNDSTAAVRFKEAVELYAHDENHEDRTKNLLLLGKMSMDLWKDLYEEGDDELKGILEDSNYNPCYEPNHRDKIVLHDGYRIDLIYDVPDARIRALGMQATYTELGYNHCRILTPDEVMAIDPSLADFCKDHSELDDTLGLNWKNDCSALWRPGGCISTPVFLPKFYDYLKKKMGTYTDASGEIQDCFRLEFEREVTAVEFDNDSNLNVIGLKFADGSSVKDNAYYVFCPGEAVGTLNKLGFDEPAYSAFAGPSLALNIPLSSEQAELYKNFSHCMEVHKVGIVLAWQARYKENRLIIGVAGTKAFYGDQLPKIDQDFARNRHLVQLNMVNDVLPEMVSIACGYDTKAIQLSFDDIHALESQGILNRWVGRRSVAYDGFPTLGALYRNGCKVGNARCTTHMGSGGVSFAPAAVKMSRSFENLEDAFAEKILQYADSRRHPPKM